MKARVRLEFTLEQKRPGMERKQKRCWICSRAAKTKKKAEREVGNPGVKRRKVEPGISYPSSVVPAPHETLVQKTGA